MGVRGKKPKPTNLKVLHGAEKRYINGNEPKPETATPEMPEWLPGEAKKEWERLAGELEKLGLLTVLDTPAFIAMLTHYGIAIEAAKLMAEDDYMSVDERKLPRKHPMNQVLRDHSAAFRQYLTEFGMSPSSRSRLSVESKENNNPFEEFLKRGKG